MEYNKEDIFDMITLLKLIPQHGEGISWYFLERVLARREHNISKDGKLMILLKNMETEGFIECNSITNSTHPGYTLTLKGKEWLLSQGND